MQNNNENLIKGVVTEVFPNQCSVILDSDPSKKLLCSYRRSQFLNKKTEWRERSPVAPGDYPPFSPGLIDRFLIATQQEKIVPLIVINKMDLAAGVPEFDRTPWKLYTDMGYQCFPVSAHDPESLQILKDKVKGKTSVFCGHSGVGKTSLLHEIFGEKIGKIGSVNSVTGKGKHTPTCSILLQPEVGTRFIDTPGIKEFGLFNIKPNELLEHFPELYELDQKREKYDHLSRYQSYLRIKQGLEEENR